MQNKHHPSEVRLAAELKNDLVRQPAEQIWVISVYKSRGLSFVYIREVCLFDKNIDAKVNILSALLVFYGYTQCMRNPSPVYPGSQSFVLFMQMTSELLHKIRKIGRCHNSERKKTTTTCTQITWQLDGQVVKICKSMCSNIYIYIRIIYLLLSFWHYPVMI